LFVVSFVPYATGLISSFASSLDAEQTVIAICAGVIALFSITLVSHHYMSHVCTCIYM